MDLDFKNMSKDEAIRKYLDSIEGIRIYAARNNIPESDFQAFILRSFKPQNPALNLCHSVIQKLKLRKRSVMNLLTLFLIVFIGIRYRSEASSLFLRKVQNFIYPSMKMVRKAAVPILHAFPTLSDLYEESCLVPNPYFQVGDGIDCSACLGKTNILDFSEVDNDLIFEDSNSMPFFIKIDAPKVSLTDLWTFFNTHRHEIAETSSQSKVFSSSSKIKNIDSLLLAFLNTSQPDESHNLWRCNRVRCAKALRDLIKKSKHFPSSGFSVERFIIVDTSKASSYRLPDTECSNVFIQQLQGTRKFLLLPTAECRKQCSKLSIVLPEGFALFFNWWLYKAVSIPVDNANVETVNFVGSYC